MPGSSVMQMRIDGFPCEVENETSDVVTSSVVKHSIIGWDGPLLEDNGVESRSVTLSTLWVEDAYKGHYDWMKFKSDIHELVHPVYGVLYGSIASRKIVHRCDDIMTARIEIEFLETGLPVYSDFGSTESAVSQADSQGQKIVDQCVASTAASLFPSSTPQQNRALSASGALQSIYRRGKVAVDSVMHEIEFPTSISGTIVERAYYAVASAMDSKDALLAAPQSILIGFQTKINGIIAELMSLSEDVVVEAVENAAAYCQLSQAAEVIDYYQKQIQSSSSEMPTQQQVFTIVDVFRAYVAPVIQRDRGGTTALASLAASVTESAYTLVEMMGSDRVVTVVSEQSIFMVLIANNVFVSRAETVCKRNGIVNPNRVIGTIVLPQADW